MLQFIQTINPVPLLFGLRAYKEILCEKYFRPDFSGSGFGGSFAEFFELFVDGGLKSFEAAIPEADAVDKNSGCTPDAGLPSV